MLLKKRFPPDHHHRRSVIIIIVEVRSAHLGDLAARSTFDCTATNLTLAYCIVTRAGVLIHHHDHHDLRKLCHGSPPVPGTTLKWVDAVENGSRELRRNIRWISHFTRKRGETKIHLHSEICVKLCVRWAHVREICISRRKRVILFFHVVFPVPRARYIILVISTENFPWPTWHVCATWQKQS